MEGIILGYEAGTATGVIRSADGSRYRFGRTDWKSPQEPMAGDRVDFVAQEELAIEIYRINGGAGSILRMWGSLQGSELAVPTLVYAFYAAALLYGITMVFGVVVAYLYRDSADGTWYRSHYDYQIAIFWKSLVYFLIAIPLTFFYGLGMLIVLGTYLWVIVKIIKGWRCLAE